MANSRLIRVRIFTRDRYLRRKIELELLGAALCVGEGEEYDLAVSDGVDGNSVPSGRMISLGDGCDLPLPFPLGALRELVKQSTEDVLVLDVDSRTVYLYGIGTRLTEVELSLFAAIYGRRGSFATREELLREVWGDGTDSGVVNVYIHYLREKLERGGEKIIISSRREGYKIDERFFGGEINA